MLQFVGLRQYSTRPSWSSTVLLCLLPLLFRVRIVASSESALTTAEVNPKPDNFILSLWDSLKKNLDPNGISTKNAATQSASNSNQNHQYSRAGASSRRRLLMEKTIHEHFFKMTHTSGDGAKIADSIRWKQQVAGNENSCYLYSHSKEAFWSFKWCPQSSVSQGQRNPQMLLDNEISLGSYLELPSSANASALAHSQLQELFPVAEVEIYWSGDFCTQANGSRMSAVVIHDESSAFCKDFDLQDFTISQVHEPKTCAYLLHACRPRMLRAPERKEEHIPEPQSNETYEHIQSMLHAYLYRTQRQEFEASNPDLKTSLQESMPPLPQSRISSNRKLIKEMFEHAYDSYMYNAYPASEIKPITCKPAVFNLVRIPALTLIDSLDTLIILGNYTEFARSVERLRELNDFMAGENGPSETTGIFALNQNVSVFETNIRVLGGLLSAHQLAEAFLRDKVTEADVWDSTGAILVGNDETLVCERNDDAQETEDSRGFVSSIPRCTTQMIREAICQDHSNSYWEYDGFFLKLAQDIGDRLLPAFATHTGIPYGTVNLLSGIPLDETTIASLAGGGTLSLEMELLSRLTGNMEYGKAAKLAARALWVRSSKFNTFGKHICTQRGQWTESLSGIGSNSDSFYEYLVKHYVLFPEDHSFWHSALAAYGGVHNESRLGDWYADVDLTRGLSTNGVSRRIFEALMAFYPGMQVLLGEILPAARSLNSFFLVREYLGFLPERFDYGNWRVDGGGGSHFLRPELIESAYFLHRATKGLQGPKSPSRSMSASSWQWAADYALQALDTITRCNCGFASLRETAPLTTGAAALGSPASPELIDDMPSFFLSETLKYLYLTFDDDNILHDNEDRDWIFTTEAHPIHHVDVSNNEEKLPRLESRKKELIRRLHSRLSGHSESTESTWDGLGREKWTTGTPLEAFAQKLHPFVSEENKNQAQQRDTVKASLTEPILSIDHIHRGLDVFGETQNGMNDAHLMLKRNGKGVALAKSCPNFYSSELLYIGALSGGGTDYTTSYVSTLRDVVHPGESRFLMMGSIDALAWYGLGIHVIEAFDPKSFCVIEYGEQQSSPTEEGSNNEKERKVASQRFDGGDLGNFEILAFDGGAGFSIKHVDSGQSIATTIIQDAASKSGDTYFMVDHKIPPRKELEAPATNVVHQSDTVAHRSVVMTDERSNSHVCVVEIIEKTYLLREDPSDQWYVDAHRTRGEAMETVLAQYPCAPALFGVTHPNNLASKSEIRSEAHIQTPKEGDAAGCKESSDQLYSSDEQDQCGESITVTGPPRIQLVQRGSCTFQDKSRNQVGAEAVIVINSKEKELFVMSGNGEEIDSEFFDVPLTVLVSGADGLDMIKKAEAFSAERNSVDTADVSTQLSCRVSVVREKTKVTNDGNEFTVVGNQFWPAVVASPDAVQVFVEDGWGVHAVQKSSAGPEPAEWQLYLLRHSTGQENAKAAEEQIS